MISASKDARGFRNRAAMFASDQHGAGHSIELVAAVAVGILVLAALLKLVIGQGGFLPGAETQLAKLIRGEPIDAGELPDGNPGTVPGGPNDGPSDGTPDGSDNGSPNDSGGDGSGSNSPTPSTPGTSTPGGDQPDPSQPSPSEPDTQNPPVDEGSGFWERVIPSAFTEMAKWMAKTHLNDLLDKSKGLAEKTKVLRKWLDNVEKMGRTLDLMSGLDDLFATERKSKELIKQGRYKEAWENDCSGLARFLVGQFADKFEKVPYVGKYVVGKFLIATGLTEAAGSIGGWIGGKTYDRLNHAANWLARQPWWPKNRGARNPT